MATAFRSNAGVKSNRLQPATLSHELHTTLAFVFTHVTVDHAAPSKACTLLAWVLRTPPSTPPSAGSCCAAHQARPCHCCSVNTSLADTCRSTAQAAPSPTLATSCGHC